MAPPLLTLQDIHLGFGGAALLEAVELVVAPGERLCLVGRNGSGKSTLLKIAAGSREPDRGSRFIQPGVVLRYLPQAPDLTGFSSVVDYVEAGLGHGDDRHLARSMLGQCGLTGGEDPRALSGGEVQRAALARALAPKPDILLLDEPTNHLDLPAIEWLEAELKGSRAALVLISHDRRFLETLAAATVWLDRGTIRRLDRGFAHFEAWRDEQLENESRDRHKLRRKIARENDWLRYGVSARRKRNQGRLRALQDLRRRHRDQPPPADTVKLTQTVGALSGKLIAEAEGIGKSYGGRAVVKDFSIRIRRGSRIGVVGPNGAGKTTLLNMLTGLLAPDTGAVRLGANLEMITLDQRRESLDPRQTLAHALTGGEGDTVLVQGKPKHVFGYMKDFLFTADQARLPIGALSGGERGRLMLARALARPSNLLVLDEPTNDLDLETLDLLQEMLGDYSGTLILVSHDRDFLDRVATTVIAAHGDGRWVEYAGGYSDMIAQRGAQKPPPERAPDKAAKRKHASSSRRGKRKFSFKDKHSLAAVDARMAALQARIAKLRIGLADIDLFGRDAAAFAAKSTALDTAESELAAAEEEWLALEMLREEAENR